MQFNPAAFMLCWEALQAHPVALFEDVNRKKQPLCFTRTVPLGGGAEVVYPLASAVAVEEPSIVNPHAF